MIRLTEKQKNVIQLFNASEISVTEFVQRLAEDNLVVEELCPTPTDAQDAMIAYGVEECIRLPRIRGAGYGSHAALQVIVLKHVVKTPRKTVNQIYVVDIKGGQ